MIKSISYDREYQHSGQPDCPLKFSSPVIYFVMIGVQLNSAL